MSKLDYGTARKVAEEIIELYKVAEQTKNADEAHMVALYLLGRFKELRIID